MIKELIVSKEVRDVRAARWDGFKRLAMRLPDHHVLSVELVRTRHDETAAVFTVVRNREPIQYVVMGDAQGRVRPDGRCEPRSEHAPVARAAAMPPTAAAGPQIGPSDGDYGDAAPDGMALGEPPVKQPPTPGVIAAGGVLLSMAFGVTEQLTSDAGR